MQARRPVPLAVLCAPHHYRLDWNIWFLGFKPHGQMLRQREGWLIPFVAKVLRADAALALFAAGAADGPAFRSSADGKARAPTYAKVGIPLRDGGAARDCAGVLARRAAGVVEADVRGAAGAGGRLDEGGELVRAGP